MRVLHVDDDENVLRAVKILLADRAEVTYCASLMQRAVFGLVILRDGSADDPGLNLLPLLIERRTLTLVILFFARGASDRVFHRMMAVLMKSRVNSQKLLATVKRLTGLHDLSG